MKNFKFFLLALLILPCALLFAACGENTGPSTRTISEGESIQEVLDVSNDGDIIILKAGTYDEDITIRKRVVLEGEEGVLLTGTITVEADNAAFNGLQIQHEYTDHEQTDSNFVITGRNFTLKDCVVERTTGVTTVYGDIITYKNESGTLKIYNSTLIAPVAGSREQVNADSPSVIGGIAGPDSQQTLIVQDSTFKTNSYAVFDRYNTATFKNTTFTGLDAESNVDGVEYKECPTAVNNCHCTNVRFLGCTFKNIKNGAVFMTGGKLDFEGNTFENIKFESSVGGTLVFCGNWGNDTYEKLDEITIKNNTFDLQGINQGITFYYVFNENSKITIDNNKFKNCEEGALSFTILNVRENGGKDVTATRTTYENCAENEQIRGVVQMADASGLMSAN